jgi:hypothetical protein
MADPVALGIVESLAHPGGNITGITTDAAPRFGASVSICCARPLRERRERDSWRPALCGRPLLGLQAYEWRQSGWEFLS